MDYLQPKFYRFNQDSLWLAEIAAEKTRGSSPSSLLDIGAGCGVVGIETANKIPSIKKAVFLEPQEDFQECLRQNQKRLLRSADFQTFSSKLEDFSKSQRYDLVVCNPPYFNMRSSRPSPDRRKAFCRTFHNSSLGSFFSFSQDLLAPRGEAFFLARSDNNELETILRAFHGNLEVVARQKEVLVLNLFNEERS